jgi:PAS domain S-box-containing protein
MTTHRGKTKKELEREISDLRTRIAQLEAAEANRTLLEQALEKSEIKFKTLTEKSVVGVYLIQDGVFRYVNPKLAEIFGYERSDLIGKTKVLELVYHEDRPILEENLRKRLSGQIDSMNYQFRGIKKDGAVIDIEAYGSRMDHQGAPAVIGSLVDISERLAMESQMREHERMAYLGHLSASLSHEIRNPLSSIKMNLQILARRLDVDGYDRRRLEITVHEVSRLEGILRQLLDVARPLTIEAAPVNLSALARGCVDFLHAKANEKQVNIVVRCPMTLPLAQLDAGKLEQALLNLLLNAMEATPEGGRITVWTKARGSGENSSLELGVRDTGPGIEQEHMPHLFTPFYTSKSRGSGLGLGNVKRIVDAHSGNIEVRSRRGQGATFLLRLPCRL